jgi:hypothetical protein
MNQKRSPALLQDKQIDHHGPKKQTVLPLAETASFDIPLVTPVSLVLFAYRSLSSLSFLPFSVRVLSSLPPAFQSAAFPSFLPCVVLVPSSLLSLRSSSLPSFLLYFLLYSFHYFSHFQIKILCPLSPLFVLFYLIPAYDVTGQPPHIAYRLSSHASPRSSLLLHR